MKSLLTSSMIAGVLFFAGCSHAEQRETSTPAGDWRLEMTLSERMTLSDDPFTDANTIDAQLRQLDLRRFVFRDPVQHGEQQLPLMLKLIPSGGGRDVVFRWSSAASASTGAWSFSGCTSGGMYVPCELQPIFNCLRNRADEHKVKQDTFASSSTNRSILLQWARSCGVEGVLTESNSASAGFAIRYNQVFFAPSPLLSLVIHEGIWFDYEDAVVQSVAKAVIPAAAPCTRSDGACRESPLPLEACVGCSTLVSGQLYTVFFIETLRQDYTSVKSVVYVP